MLLAIRIVAWAIAAAWVAKLAEVAWGASRVPNLLEPMYDVEPAGSPSVVVIVPARNEEANVRACLESLIGQDYEHLRVLAVNDRSNDATGEVMLSIANAHAARIQVLEVKALPTGWLGKTHAMAMAADHAMAEKRPQYLLFTDADIVFRRDTIRRAVAQAESTKADHFVVLPTTIVKTWGEGIILAYLQTMSLWAIRPWRVEDAKAKRDAIGVGAFNMIRTEAYEELGGFTVARMEILEDLDLGRRVKRAGLKQRVGTAAGMVSVHWAAGAHGIMAGMTKNLFAVFRFRAVGVIGACMGIAVTCLGPEVMLAYRGTRLAGVVAFAAVAGLYAISARTTRIGWIYALGFPFASAAVMYSMMRSMVVTLVEGGVNWRGTFYPLSALREQAKRRL